MQGEFNDAIGATGCQLCSENSFATDKHRESPCDQCASGRTSKKGSTKCSDCAPGTFKDGVVGFEVCTDCPIGFAQSDTDQESCTQCIEGEEAPTGGSSFCAACDLGTFNLIAGQDCLACPAGQYQDGKGETSCKKCLANTYLIESGKSSNADCQKCSKERSTGSATGSITAAACLCKRTDYYQNDKNECEPCPPGADCSKHDGLKLSEVFALPGYYRFNNAKLDTTFIPCSQAFTGSNAVGIAEQRCCPLKSNISTCSTMNASSNPNLQCLKG